MSSKAVFYGDFEHVYDKEMWDYVESVLGANHVSFGSCSSRTPTTWSIHIKFVEGPRMATRLHPHVSASRSWWSVNVWPKENTFFGD